MVGVVTFSRPNKNACAGMGGEVDAVEPVDCRSDETEVEVRLVAGEVEESAARKAIIGVVRTELN